MQRTGKYTATPVILTYQLTDFRPSKYEEKEARANGFHGTSKTYKCRVNIGTLFVR